MVAWGWPIAMAVPLRWATVISLLNAISMAAVSSSLSRNISRLADLTLCSCAIFDAILLLVVRESTKKRSRFLISFISHDICTTSCVSELPMWLLMPLRFGMSFMAAPRTFRNCGFFWVAVKAPGPIGYSWRFDMGKCNMICRPC